MPEQFIYPNWHVLALHFPLGLLGVGVVLEWLSYVWPKSAIRTGGRWMIVMGALLAIPTTTLGVYAYRDVVTPQGSIALDWPDAVRQSHWSGVQWQYMTRHIWLEAIGTGLAVLVAVIGLACSDHARRKLRAVGLLLLTAALGLMVVGGWYSGEAVYRYGTAVAAATPDASGRSGEPLTVHGQGDQQESSASDTRLLPATAPAALDRPPEPAQTDRDSANGALTEPDHALQQHAEHEHAEHAHPAWVVRYIPPLQLHLLMVGATIAFAMAAIGLSIRRWSQEYGPLPASQIPASAGIRAGQPIAQEPAAHAPGSPIAPAPAVVAPATILLPIFPARFWLAAFVFGLLTAIGGLWMTGDWTLDALVKPLQAEGTDWSNKRVFWHVIFGLTIVLSTLLLAITTRVSRRAKFFTLLFVFILLLAVAAQVWLGILMLFDSPHGPVTGFAA